MKKSAFILILLALLITLFPLTALAHPGKTDSSGGHTDSSTGEYHYHHGYPAHKHPGGVCPYDNKIGNTSGSTGDGVWNGGSWHDDSDDVGDYTTFIIVTIILSIIFAISFFISQRDSDENFFQELFEYKYDGVFYRIVKSIFFVPNIIIAVMVIVVGGAYCLFDAICSFFSKFIDDDFSFKKIPLILCFFIFLLLKGIAFVFMAFPLFSRFPEGIILGFLEDFNCVGEEIRDVVNVPSATISKKEPTNLNNPPVAMEQKVLDAEIEDDEEERIEFVKQELPAGWKDPFYKELQAIMAKYNGVLLPNQWNRMEFDVLTELNYFANKRVNEEGQDFLNTVNHLFCVMGLICDLVLQKFNSGWYKTYSNELTFVPTSYGKKYKKLYLLLAEDMMTKNYISQNEHSDMENALQKAIASPRNRSLSQQEIQCRSFFLPAFYKANNLDTNEQESEFVVEAEKEQNAYENSQTPTIIPKTIPADWEKRFTIEFENVLSEKKELLQVEQYKILERDFLKTLSSLDKHVTTEEFLHYLDVVDYKMYVMNTVCDLILKYFNAGRYKKTSPNSPVELTSHGKGYSKLYINLIDDMLAFRFLTQFGYDERTKDLQRAIDKRT